MRSGPVGEANGRWRLGAALHAAASDGVRTLSSSSAEESDMSSILAETYARGRADWMAVARSGEKSCELPAKPPALAFGLRRPAMR